LPNSGQTIKYQKSSKPDVSHKPEEFKLSNCDEVEIASVAIDAIESE
jgi:hypothetical protein